jgi:hypothetical protein
MSMRILPLALLALMLLPAAASAETLADTSVGFSADRVLVIDGHRYVGKIWAIPGEERHEQAIEAFRPIFLLHSGSPLAEIVVPQLKTVVEFVMPRELHLLESPELRKHPVGHDTVNGIATTRYTIDQSLPEGHASGLLWLSRDGIPMKLTGTWTGKKGKAARVSWELSHVKVGPQPPELFTPPHDFSKLPAAAIMPLIGLRLKSPH